MIVGVYSIRDVRSSFLNPTFELNDAVAMRNFHHACLNESSLFYSHPSDYSLYRIGTFNTDTGILTSFDKEFICDAEGVGSLV